MPIPAGYTQGANGLWTKTSDGSGPYAWNGSVFFLMSLGTSALGVPPDYTQHPNGYWYKTADASGPYAYDGTSFWLAGSGGGVIPVGGAVDLYNLGGPGEANYERLRLDWSGNVARVWMQHDGTGSSRELRVGIASADAATTPAAYHSYNANTPNIAAVIVPALPATSTIHQLAAFTVNASSGIQTLVGVAPTINQSGTAGYTAFDINPTETATGSGTRLLQRWAVGGTAKAALDNAGIFWTVQLVACPTLSFGVAIGAGSDVTVARDAADTLGMRRSTNAQTFRIYNTFTDASNYERGVFDWSTTAGALTIGTANAGTGIARSMRFQVGNAAVWSINTSGHFLAVTDNAYDIGAPGATRPRNLYTSGVVIAGGLSQGNFFQLIDGISAPGTTAGIAKIYVDSADGDLKVIFGDGVIKTLATDV